MFSVARRCLVLGIGIGTLLSLPARAHAEPNAAQIQEARRLFEEATELRESGKWAEAAAKLQAALAIKETPGLWFNLAHCEEERGRLVEAGADYERASVLIRDGAKAPDVATLLAPARAALHERIPTLSVRVTPADARDLRVTVDDGDVSPAALGTPLPVDPGAHHVVVEAADRQTFALDVSLREGDDRVVEAKLEPSPPSVTAAPPQNTDSPGRPEKASGSPGTGVGLREAVLIGEGAVTLAGLVVGTVFAVESQRAGDRVDSNQGQIDRLARSQQSDSGSACLATPVPACHDLQLALNDQVQDRNIAIGGFIGAGVGAAALLTTALLWKSKGSHDVRHAVFVPIPGGVLVRGTF